MAKGSPVVNFRVPQAVLDAARLRAKADGDPLNAVVVHALRRYGEGAVNNVTPPPRSR